MSYLEWKEKFAESLAKLSSMTLQEAREYIEEGEPWSTLYLSGMEPVEVAQIEISFWADES